MKQLLAYVKVLMELHLCKHFYVMEKLHNVECSFCGKANQQKNKPRGKNSYCNITCFNKATKSKPIDGYKICVTCKKEFPYRNSLVVRNMYSKVHKCFIARKDQKACCFKCHMDYRNKYENPSKGIEARKKISDFAKKRGMEHLRTEQARFNHRESIKGEGHWNWQGGITPEYTRQRTWYDNKQLRINVCNRDKNKCTQCSSTDRLHVHHLKPWKMYPELRFDMNNCITLCISCHMRLERNLKIASMK